MASPTKSIQKHTLTLTAQNTTVSDLVFTVNTPPNVQMTSAGSNIPTLNVGERFSVGDHATHNGEYEVVTITTANADYIVESVSGATTTAASESAAIYRSVPATADLTGSPTIANCVPFATTRVTASAPNDDNFCAYAARVSLESGSPDKVQAQTSSRDLGNRTLVVETTVVEFDPTEVNVYSGTEDRTDNDDSTVIINAGTSGAPFSSDVTLSKSFLYFTYSTVNSQQWWRTHHIRGRITGVNELTFDCNVNMKGAIIKWWVVEAKNTAWSVLPRDITLAATVNSANVTDLGGVTTAKTFVMGSYKGSDTGDADANDENTIDVTLTSGTTLTAQRSMATPAGAINWSGFVVSFAAGGNENVYRDTLTWAASATSTTDTISSSVTVADSMVHVAGVPGTVGTGSFPGTESNDVPDAFTAWTITGPTEVTVTHATTGGEANQDLSWEVIEWDVAGGATPRRVMVVT